MVRLDDALTLPVYQRIGVCPPVAPKMIVEPAPAALACPEFAMELMAPCPVVTIKFPSKVLLPVRVTDPVVFGAVRFKLVPLPLMTPDRIYLSFAKPLPIDVLAFNVMLLPIV